MYGGLFGDLPSAKKQKSTPSSTDDSSKPNDKNGDAKEGAAKNHDAKTKTVTAPAAANSASVNWFAPPRQAAKAPKSGKSQFLQMVGKSGTTMAFVPTAALKSKRKKAIDPNTKSTSTGIEKGSTTKNVPSTTISTDQQSSFAAVTTTTTTTTRITASKDDRTKPATVVNIHGNTQKNENGGGASTTAHHVSALDVPSHTGIDDEPEKITDPYDPYVPNDLLEYWEKLAAKKHREKLERNTREALERQKAMRKQLEDERMALGRQPPAGRGRGVSNLPAWLVEQQRRDREPGSSGGDLGASTTTTPGPNLGRGRGRGVSNLPAWLVEKQRKEAANNQ